MKKIKLILVVSFFLLFNYSLFAQDYAVIVNNSVNESSLSSDKIKKIYVGKTDTWDSGSNIQLSYLDPTSTEIGSYFFDSALDISFQKFNKIWIKKVFSGYGTKPSKFSSEDAIIKFVQNTDGAIGFISKQKSSNLTGLKVIN